MTIYYGVCKQDIEIHTREIGVFALEQIKLATAPLRQRIAELDSHVAELQAGSTKLVGVWQRASEYKRGALAVHDSALWCAVAGTIPNSEPGTSKLWQLCVKSAAPARNSEAQP
jgi:hypothetical protein